MKQTSLFLLMFISIPFAMAQNGQQQDCNQEPEGDARNLCLYRQAASGGQRQQQQSQQISGNAQRCLTLFGKSAATVTQRTQTQQPQQTQQQGQQQTQQPQQTATQNQQQFSASGGSEVVVNGTPVWPSLQGPAVPGTQASPQPAISASEVALAASCRARQVTAAAAGSSSLEATAKQQSMDGRITCVKAAGYTVDYQSCMNAMSMYNNVKIAESALFIAQSVQANNNQQQVQEQTTQRVATGDGQNAIYDAQISQAQKASQLNQQKAAAYAAAVVALGSQVAGWISTDPAKAAQKLCRGNITQLGGEPLVGAAPESTTPNTKYAKPDAVPAPKSCQTAIVMTAERFSDEVFANRQAKAAFITATMELVAKGIQAGIAANQLGNIAKKVEEAKKATEDPYNPATFDYCSVNAADPKCAGGATRTAGSGLQDGGFSFGDSFGNNAFNPLGDEETLGNDPLAPLAGNETVADVNNPFADDAKKASGILDPAAAASIQPGQAGGGGGGGGAPGAGGGSASLGNDVPGVDESKKESDIKANKADGKYSDVSAGGFQAIKPLKEDNPFANLFGGGAGGKLEEDRSIASGDIDGQDSGLFAKISKRYGQVQADKRIEAKNLDE